MKYADGVAEAELDEGLVRDLKLAEMFARQEFVITSGNRAEDGRCHGIGKAVDIACSTSEDRYKIVRALVFSGFSRIGVYSRHIHTDVCDWGDDYPEKVLWLGGASK